MQHNKKWYDRKEVFQLNETYSTPLNLVELRSLSFQTIRFSTTQWSKIFLKRSKNIQMTIGQLPFITKNLKTTFVQFMNESVSLGCISENVKAFQNFLFKWILFRIKLMTEFRISVNIEPTEASFTKNESISKKRLCSL